MVDGYLYGGSIKIIENLLVELITHFSTSALITSWFSCKLLRLYTITSTAGLETSTKTQDLAPLLINAQESAQNTFKNNVANYFPILIPLLDSLYETLFDIKSFIKDLIN